MKIYGVSVLKGLLYTLKTFVSTYTEDIKRLKGEQETAFGLRTAYDEQGVCTIQYPENPMPIGDTYERFRVLPMLIYDEKEDGEHDVRCTSCGICAKVCPPQCIWIVQEMNELNKPVPNPTDFWIDMSVCMNCAMCVEFCPFDAIKMDHQIDLTVTENRKENYLYDKERLLVSSDYYAELHPKANAEEVAARIAEAEAKKAKDEAKKARLAAKKKKEAEAAAKAAEEAKNAPPVEDQKPKDKEAKADVKTAKTSVDKDKKPAREDADSGKAEKPEAKVVSTQTPDEKTSAKDDSEPPASSEETKATTEAETVEAKPVNVKETAEKEVTSEPKETHSASEEKETVNPPTDEPKESKESTT